MMRIEAKLLYPWRQGDIEITPDLIRQVERETNRFIKAGGKVWVLPGHIDLARWQRDPAYRKELLKTVLGYVEKVERRGDELYGVLVIEDPEIAKAIEEGRSASWSPGIGPVATNAGRFNPVINHVAYTLIPMQVGLGEPRLMELVLEWDNLEWDNKEVNMGDKGYVERFWEALKELVLGDLESKVIELPKPKEGELVQTRDGQPYPRRAFLFVGDPNKPSTWKLPIARYVNGRLVVDRTKLAQAAMALGPSGFRGRRVQLPPDAMRKAKAALRAWFRRLGVDESEVRDKFPWLFEGVSEEDVLDLEEAIARGWEPLVVENFEEIDTNKEVDMDKDKEKELEALRAEVKRLREELAKRERAEFEAQLEALVKEGKLEPARKARLLETWDKNREAAQLALETLADKPSQTDTTLDRKDVEESQKAEPTGKSPLDIYLEAYEKALGEGKSEAEAWLVAKEAVDKAFGNKEVEGWL